MLNILKLTASLSARRKDPLPLRATNSILSFRSRVFSGKSQRWRYHSTKLGEYDERTNAGWGASLLDITMINEWREAGGRQRRSEEAAKKYRNTATVTAYSNVFQGIKPFQDNLNYVVNVRGWYHGYGYSINTNIFCPGALIRYGRSFLSFSGAIYRTFQCEMTNRLSICTPTRDFPGNIFGACQIRILEAVPPARFCRLPRCLWVDVWAPEKFENQAQRSGRLTASFFMPAKERGWMNARSS